MGRAANSHSAWSGAPGSNAEDSLLIDQLGGDPQTAAAVPLVVREKVVAVLYADSVSSDANAVNVDALEVLARVAAMAVNLASAPRAVPEQPAEPATVAPAAEAESETSPTPVAAQPVAAEPAHEPEPAYTPEIEPQATEVVAEPVAEEVPAEVGNEFTVTEVPIAAGPEIVHETIAEPEVEAAPVEVEVESAPETQAEPPPEPLAAQSMIEPTAEMAPSPTAPGFASQYAAPLGGSRRYGVSEPDLPIEVGEEERRLHNDARRFARLLVSEIKLYNEPKVKEGRSRSDIYDRLREDIDRSRQMYDKRVAPPVAARHDYFHQELVNTLAEGDPAKLGEGYPGASLGAN